MTQETKNSQPLILVADDDKVIRALLETKLNDAGYQTVLARDGNETMAKLSEDIGVVLLDLEMPGHSGMECLDHIQQNYSDTQVIIITASSEISDAVEAMKAGAFDYITKPVNFTEFYEIVKKAVRVYRLSTENKQLKQLVGESKPQTPFLGKSPAIQKLLENANKISSLDSTILITGESGVGKGLLARHIHYSSIRQHKHFVTVSCASMPKELVEDELFGHEKGGFTGAHQQKPGRVEIADEGTLFLDEIGDMPIELQAKLLSFLQDRFFYRVGGNKSINVNVRVVAATNQDLTRLVKEKLFREDLFFRINVVPLHIPPLRQRPDDIPLLIEYFLNHIAEYRGTEPFSMDEEAKAALLQYDWPGNVREIENVMERTTAFSSGTIIKKVDLPPEILGSSDSGDLNPFSLSGLTLESIEKMAVEQALADCKGNKTKAAKKLGISERSIYNKINRYNISPI